MTERDHEDTTEPLVSPVLATVDEQLFDAWRSGDPAARDEAWTRLWNLNCSWAVPFCRTMAPDDLTAEAWAAEASDAALSNLEARIAAEGFSWRGESQFAGLFGQYLKRRCLDRRRAELRVTAPTRRTAGVTAQELDVVLPPVPADEEHLIEVAHTRAAIEAMVERLGGCKEVCRGRPALEAVFDAREAYLRECCVRAVVGVANAESLSLDELVPLLDRHAVEASSEEMNKFTMARLKISRGTLDVRLQEFRKLWRRAFGPDGGLAPV
ncbi:MAG: hypothetical protein K2Y23_10005 [Cyanobacteria bacterium]|nr:hypothetical protein [Cyanobacteriota bacterium]